MWASEESKKAEKCILYYDNAAPLVAVAAAKLTYNTPLLDMSYMGPVHWDNIFP